MQKRWVFSFDLKRVWRNAKHCDRQRKRVPDDRSHELKQSLPHGPPTHPQNMEDPSTRGWEKGGVIKKRLREIWRSCTRGNLETGENYLHWIQLQIHSKWRSKSTGVMCADLRVLKVRQAEQLITLSIWSRRTWGGQQEENYNKQA